MRLVRVVLVLTAVSSTFCFGTATANDIAACAVALAPEITLMNSSENIKYAWLVLVTEKTYDSAKQQIKASGDADLLGLISGNADYSYDQFDQHRREYLNLHQGNYERNSAVSIFQQTLPPKAGETFVSCIREAATVADGLHVWFSDETSDQATVHVRYRGTPSTSVQYKYTVTGGSGTPATESLPNQGEMQHIINRKMGAKEIRLVVASTNPPGLSDSATSVRPGPGVQAPTPKFVPSELWSPNIAQPDGAQCQFTIKDRTLQVMAYDAPNSGLGLVLSGKVSPQPGNYELAPSTDTDTTILTTRKLDDFVMDEDSQAQLKGPNGANALLVTAPPHIQGCQHYQLHFSNAQVLVKQPPPVYVVADAVTTEQHDYKRSGDYPNHWGNIGCPNCGDLYAADLVSKLSKPVATIDSVVFLKQTGSPQWYRCYSVSPACGTNGETTATLDRQSGSCSGKATCYSWRFSTDGNEATDTYEIKYKEKRCVRYCGRS